MGGGRVRVLGVDACRDGWVAVELCDGRFSGALVSGGLRSLLSGAAARGVAAVGVDMPLGLVESGWRRADAEAAALLGGLRSSVFRVPPRAVWQEDGYEAAGRLCRELTGAGLSRQTWALAVRLREANACRDSAEGGERLFEVHPEVSFWALAGKTPLGRRKKSWEGQMTRRSLLEAAGVALPDALGEAGRVPPDDVLDAAAAAWSAHRIAQGAACPLPDPPESDRHGRPIAIWY
ncbi:DUF429 domain-containing protein [Streptomyces sp. PR69]|uniref:DUF429 domain-containing protein n=1 Tax=Streptomyces sp. PR69 TaxID=2984950 RepID=UPI002264E4C8|nr:DUF429 domain-containing protein [Streptomyces sp. PR69]